MPSIKNVLDTTPATKSISAKLKSFVRAFIEDDNKSSPMDEKVLIVVGVAVLAYFVGDAVFSYIDQNFLSVVCKAKYFVTP